MGFDAFFSVLHHQWERRINRDLREKITELVTSISADSPRTKLVCRFEPNKEEMTHVSTADLAEQLEQENTSYLEVLSKDELTVELAQYPNPEPKTPHKTDELYYIISGSGMVHVGNERYAVDDGDVVYVEQGVEHDFFDIDDEITALIVFVSSEESVLGRNL